MSEFVVGVIRDLNSSALISTDDDSYKTFMERHRIIAEQKELEKKKIDDVDERLKVLEKNVSLILELLKSKQT